MTVAHATVRACTYTAESAPSSPVEIIAGNRVTLNDGIEIAVGATDHAAGTTWDIGCDPRSALLVFVMRPGAVIFEVLQDGQTRSSGGAVFDQGVTVTADGVVVQDGGVTANGGLTIREGMFVEAGAVQVAGGLTVTDGGPGNFRRSHRQY